MIRTIALVVALSVLASPAPTTGPSSSHSPYIVPVAPGVDFTSILTVGDSVKKKNGASGETYRMVGIPDGLGAYDNRDGTFTVLMNHEIPSSQGVARVHGGKGAFVSRWQIRKKDLKVLNGEDLTTTVKLWNGATETWVDGTNVAMSRLCSADLAPRSAFYDSDSDKGYSGWIYLNGEEDSGSGFGRAFAHLSGGSQDRTTYELPRFGRVAWENVLASPYEQEKTVVVGLEDTGGGIVYVYVGDKQEDGNPVERAGLNNGINYELKIPGYTNDDPVTGFKSGTFELVTSAGTGLDRPEDGHWDPTNRNRFYFVTTASFSGNSRLWLMEFEDVRHPELGGTIKVVVEGNLVPGAQIKMMDNICADQDGNVFLQEDVGNNVRLGRVWRYNAKGGSVTEIGIFDSNRFISGAPNDIDGTSGGQSDEESSGIIEVTPLFKGVDGYKTSKFRYYLMDVQAHYSSVNGVALDAELVQGGQLLLMAVPKPKKNDKDDDDDDEGDDD